MKNISLRALMVLVTILASLEAISQPSKIDSVRTDELDRYWAEVARTVQAGDYEGYGATYHPDAVCVFTTGKNKRSSPIDEQLALWKPGFVDTQAGKVKNKVEFRFSQRVGDHATAHETGIFFFTSADKDGKILSAGGVHFESLLVKRNGKWLALMEYQKSKATQAEWDALK